MDTNTYLETRVEDQVKYYNLKSAVNKKRFQRLQFTSIVCGIAVPVLIGFSEQVPMFKYAAGGLSALVAIIESAQSLFKHKENWLTYRATAEALIRERFLFLSEAGHYEDKSRAFKLFVEQIESILNTENRIWLTNSSETKDKK